jgi:hypothetical protein
VLLIWARPSECRSARFTSVTQWFRCMSSAATREERHAAHAKLVRLLAGDATRARPAISLAGRPAPPTAPPPAAPSTAPTVKQHSWRQALPRGKTARRPYTDADARDPYSREQLERMDGSFVKRLERAIAHGKERPHA